MQTPEVWGECDTYRLTPFSTRGGLVGMFMPQGLPKARSAMDTRGAWVGGWPHKCQIFTAFPFFSIFFSFPISSDVNFLCVVVVVVILFLKTNHIWSCFLQTQAPGEGARQTQTCDRQAVRPRAARLQTPTLSGETGAALTAVGPQVRPSSGSARSATCHHGGATHVSLRTGWYGAGPARRYTA